MPALLLYSWQPLKEVAGGADGARHAGMTQRLMQVVGSACRLGLDVFFLSGQPIKETASTSGSKRRGQVFVRSCRVTHFYGTTEQQYARLSAEGVSPLFAFVFYTAAWFAIEQRAIRNSTGWASPETYLDEEASEEGGLGRKESKLLQLIRSDHAAVSIAGGPEPEPEPEPEP